MTKILRVNSTHPEPDIINQAAQVILNGGLVAFPTETVYGLGANALDEKAVSGIFLAKGRPSNDPLIVHLCDLKDLQTVASSVPPKAMLLAETLWPGPLTLVLPRQNHISNLVTAGLENVAVRVPAHPVALALIRAAGVPLAAPSANRFGHTSPTTAEHVLNDLSGRIDLILDGGATSVGVESTVLDLSGPIPRILRPGGVTREIIENLIGPVALYNERVDEENGLPSPGLLKKHYAPSAPLLFFSGEKSAQNLKARLPALLEEGKSVGILATDEDYDELEKLGGKVFNLGAAGQMEIIASNLYAGIRALDKHGVDVILCSDLGGRGLGIAIRDRLMKAATQIIL